MMILGIVIIAIILLTGYFYRKELKQVWEKHSKKVIAIALASSMAAGGLYGVPSLELNIDDYLIDEISDYEDLGFNVDKIENPIIYESEVLCEGHLPLAFHFKELSKSVYVDNNLISVSQVDRENLNLFNQGVRILANISFTREEPIYESVPYTYNETVLNNKTKKNTTKEVTSYREEITGYKEVSDYKYVWKDLDSLKQINEGDLVVIDIIGQFKASTGSKKVDIVPTLNLDSYSKTYSKYARWNSNWLYKKEITLNSSQVPSTQTNFPVCINITDTDLRDKAQSDGDDIAFVDSSETSQLNHEVEQYNSTTGRLVAWVNITSLSDSVDTVIYMYYNNSAAANQESVTDTWHSNYEMVHHCEETDIDGGSGDIKDSTSNNNNVTSNNMDTDDSVDERFNGGFFSIGSEEGGVPITTNSTTDNCFTFTTLNGFAPNSGIVGFEWGLTDSYDNYYNLTRAECWEVDTSAEWNADGTFSNTEMWTNDGVLDGNLVLSDVSMGAWQNYWTSSTYQRELGKPYDFCVQKANADLSGHDEARVGSYIKTSNGAYACSAKVSFENHSNEYQSTASTGYVWVYDSIPSIYLGDTNWYIKGYYSALFGSYWGYMDGQKLQYQDVSDYQNDGYWLSNWQSFPDDFLPNNVTSDIDALGGGIVNITLESSQDGAAVDESESFTNLPLGVNINETSLSKAPYFRLNVSLEEGTDTPQVNYIKLCGYNLIQGEFNYTLSGLSNCTTYHYRAINNISGTIYEGEDMDFTTYCTPYISSINIKNGDSINETSPTINITVLDNDNATMNITWYESVNCSVYVEVQTNTSVANNTNASWTYTNASSRGNTYCFKVVIDDYGCGGPIEYYYTFNIVYETTINISNSGRDYFCWKGDNCTLSSVGENISGFDESNEFVAVWNASSWTTNEGCWIKYYGDGNGTDANVNQLDVIYSYLEDSGIQTITMIADSLMSCDRTVKLTDLSEDVNKGYNYTCYCCNIKNLLNISDISTNIGLQTGEVISWWDNSTQEWKAWIEGISHSDYDYTINVTSPIFETKVANNYSWVISCP